MATKDADFRRKLLATFSVEAAEHIQALSSGLIELESARTAKAREAITETVFRAAHSLKGAARAVGLGRIERLCQLSESAFSALQRKELVLSKAALDVLHETVDALGALLRAGAEADGAVEPAADAALLARLEALLDPSAAAPREPERLPAAPPVEPPLLAGTVRVPISRLDALLYQSEELLSTKLSASEQAAELRSAANALREAASLEAFRQRMAALANSAEQHRRALGAMVDALLEDMKRALMLPASALLEIFPKLARDLARDQGKEVKLVLAGADIEIDRRILDEMRDPLVHLIRNCVDHGIEAPQERGRNGKPAQGTITLALRRKGEGTMEILVADDGAGIDAAKVVEAALNRGIVSRNEIAGRPPAELLALVFRSGLSTSPIITDLSGRGLGLAIVREKVERLGGSVAVEAQPGRGTTFRVVLPLTLATFRGVHVRVGDRRLVLPTTYVQQVLRVKRQDIETVANRPTIQWNGQVLALVHLADMLGLPAGSLPGAQGELLKTLVLGAADRRIALVVDDILEEGEVLVKPLRKPLVRMRNIAGAAVLGTGETVPILEVPDLVVSAAQAAFARTTEPQAPAEKIAALIAEDSITSRALLKGILESAGYEVATAVDGAEALRLLKSRHFDIVVSDVEMPRMDGFDLTARIRADGALSELPVVLVTALESREHRERGIDVGASAYIVKSSFDQSNLLEVMRQLV